MAPQEHNGWFCPECGSTVGQYSNYLPNVYIFSIGEALRTGLAGRIRQPLILFGYFLVLLSWFSLLAPICFYFLLKNIKGDSSASTVLQDS